MGKISSSNKTQPTTQTVSAYIKTLPPDEQKQAQALVHIFKAATSMKPVMWGSMIGFGTYHYKYASGREGDMFATGFAIRKSGPTIYIMPGYKDYSSILKNLGPHKLGKSCLYIKSVSDIDVDALTSLIKTGLKDLSTQYAVTAT